MGTDENNEFNWSIFIIIIHWHSCWQFNIQKRNEIHTDIAYHKPSIYDNEPLWVSHVNNENQRKLLGNQMNRKQIFFILLITVMFIYIPVNEYTPSMEGEILTGAGYRFIFDIGSIERVVYTPNIPMLFLQILSVAIAYLISEFKK
ncbi:hypothetical protein ACQ6UL_005378 [Klebsiella pneumoniae]